MPYSSFLTPADKTTHPTFIGLHDDFCFTPTWLTPNKNGYLGLYVREIRNIEHAHRLVAKLLLGPLAEGDMVLHRCGNASCVNPNHLYVGGTEENQRDKILHKIARINSTQIEFSSLHDDSWVRMSKPPVLSREASRIKTNFAGFSPERCFFDEWLHTTQDGFRQLWKTIESGEITGAHRKIYMLFNGPLERYDILKHTCQDKNCLNPHHLIISGKSNQQEFDIKHDNIFKITTYGHSLNLDYTKSSKEVAHALNIHPQTVATIRATQRGKSKLMKMKSI